MNRSIKNIVFAGIILSLLLSCEKPKDYFLKNNQQPIADLKSSTGYFNEINDMHKLSLNNQYSCIFRYTDDQDINYVEVQNVSGNGEYHVIDSIFYYTPDTTGQHIFNITFYDPYGYSTSCKLNINVFWNMLPIAIINYSISDNLLTVDASDSYDQDEEYGGTISEYLFILDGNEYRLSNSMFNQSINPDEIHIIKLQVKDNDGEWSLLISDIISTNN